MTNAGWLVLLLDSLEEGDVKEQAAAIALKYGGIDGGMHKMWVIDQMLRLLAGDDYKKWIMSLEEAGFSWDEGIAP